jgi:hypothetical protein
MHSLTANHSQAVDAGEAENIRLLNSRSLLYEKLNRLESALKDARKVIKLSSGDPGVMSLSILRKRGR